MLRGAKRHQIRRANYAKPCCLGWPGLDRPARRGLDADHLLNATRADIGLRIERELLFCTEAGDVLVEPRPSLRRHVDPVLLAGENLDVAESR